MPAVNAVAPERVLIAPHQQRRLLERRRALAVPEAAAEAHASEPVAVPVDQIATAVASVGALWPWAPEGRYHRLRAQRP